MVQFLLAVILEDEIGLCTQKRESFREPLGNWLVAASSTVEAALILSVLPVLVTVLLYTFFCSERHSVPFTVLPFWPILSTLWSYDKRKKCGLILYPFLVLTCAACVIVLLKLPSHLLHKVKIALAPS